MALEKLCLINTLERAPVLGFLLAGDNYALRKCKGDSAGDRPGLVAESLHHCLVGRQIVPYTFKTRPSAIRS